MHIPVFNGPLSRTTRVSQYQKGKTNLDFTEAREWHWHQLGHMRVCISLQTDNHASTPSLSFLQAGCPSCRPTNSVKALKALGYIIYSTSCVSVSVCWSVGWRRGVVVSVVHRMNEVNRRRARLVLGWVTVSGWTYDLGM